MTYDELVTNIRNYTEVDSNVFTAAVINTFITMAENRILRDIDLDVFRIESTGTSTQGDRFLIAPSVKVKHLASHVLARCQARVVDDWETVYHYRPVLLETYVERGRFAGTCYRAANWLHVGVTGGRGRQDAAGRLPRRR